MPIGDSTLHIISHTHWDREWYQPFVGYQRRLVFAMDRLLELLDGDSGFRAFYLDAQTCMVDDYLAIRPEAEAKFRAYLADGRLGMGPWYVMPDELLVSGEALVRNLEKGVKRCVEMGCKAVPLLHASDVFGHCSQMPQIMRGFGIDKTMLLRGTSAEDEQSEMLWTGADGSRVWILKVFPDTGYCDVWTYRREKDPEKLRAYEARKVELSTTPVLIGLDGNDHQAPFGPINETIERMCEAFESTEVRHSSMAEALEALDKFLDLDDPDERRHFHGELRTPAKTGMWNEVFFGTASARVPTKQKNDRAQILLARVAEPLHALSVLNGGDPDRTFLERAWEYLLKCHPHDSIVGCSTDQVDRDVHYRLDQAIELARDGAGEALFYLAARKAKATNDSKVVGHLFVFNPSTSPAGPVIEVEVEVPHDPIKRRPVPPAIRSESGDVIASSLQLEIRGTFPSPIGRRIEDDDYPRYGCRAHETGTVDRWKGVINLGMPAFGTATLQVLEGKQKEKLESLPASAQLENEHLLITVNPDATFDMTDKRTGQQFTGLGQFEFQHDRGSGWDFKPLDASSNPSIPGETLAARSVKIRLIEENGLRSTLVVTGQLRVPAGLNDSKSKPLRRRVMVPFQHRITLDAGAAFVSIKTRLENAARDMRLRLLMPTRLPVDHWWSDSAFDVVKRPVALPDTTDFKEKARPETPIHSWASVCHGDSGLAVITQGLQEACVLDVPERPIALTLLRCYRQKIGSSETKATQQPGGFEADWNIGVFEPAGNEPGPALCRLADRCRVPVQSITLNKEELSAAGAGAELGFPTIAGDLELSAFRSDEAGLLIRVFNPHRAAHSGILEGIPDGAQAQRVEFDGRAIGDVQRLTNGTLRFELAGKEVQTWRIS